MVDRIAIQKIMNGYIVATSYDVMSNNKAIYFQTMEDLLKYISTCFIAGDEHAKKK